MLRNAKECKGRLRNTKECKGVLRNAKKCKGRLRNGNNKVLELELVIFKQKWSYSLISLNSLYMNCELFKLAQETFEYS